MLGSIISAGASLAGGLLGQRSAKKAAARQEALQREFAQSGIQWKVEDAKRAGIHPLYALGAQTTSYSPVSVGDGGLGSSIAGAGQDIGRAIDATRSPQARLDAVDTTMRALQLEGLSIDNDIKRADLASKIQNVRQAGSGPGLPSDLSTPFIAGQGDGWFKPANRISLSQAGKPESEAGLTGEVKWYRSKTGWVPQVPSELGESFEGEPWPNPSAMQWFLRNKVAPFLSGSHYNPPFPAPPGKAWYYNPVAGEYQLQSGGLSTWRK